jgi:hypothetical protein
MAVAAVRAADAIVAVAAVGAVIAIAAVLTIGVAAYLGGQSVAALRVD